jgi:hypothetical protein
VLVDGESIYGDTMRRRDGYMGDRSLSSLSERGRKPFFDDNELETSKIMYHETPTKVQF